MDPSHDINISPNNGFNLNDIDENGTTAHPQMFFDQGWVLPFTHPAPTFCLNSLGIIAAEEKSNDESNSDFKEHSKSKQKHRKKSAGMGKCRTTPCGLILSRRDIVRRHVLGPQCTDERCIKTLEAMINEGKLQARLVEKERHTLYKKLLRTGRSTSSVQPRSITSPRNSQTSHSTQTTVFSLPNTHDGRKGDGRVMPLDPSFMLPTISQQQLPPQNQQVTPVATSCRWDSPLAMTPGRANGISSNFPNSTQRSSPLSSEYSMWQMPPDFILYLQAAEGSVFREQRNSHPTNDDYYQNSTRLFAGLSSSSASPLIETHIMLPKSFTSHQQAPAMPCYPDFLNLCAGAPEMQK